MGHLEGNFTPVLYIGRKVPKGWLFIKLFIIVLFLVILQTKLHKSVQWYSLFPSVFRCAVFLLYRIGIFLKMHVLKRSIRQLFATRHAKQSLPRLYTRWRLVITEGRSNSKILAAKTNHKSTRGWRTWKGTRDGERTDFENWATTKWHSTEMPNTHAFVTSNRDVRT